MEKQLSHLERVRGEARRVPPTPQKIQFCYREQNETIVLENWKKVAAIVRAINHPLRAAILNLLIEQGPKVVTEIYVQLRLEQSVASQNLERCKNC